MNKKLEQAIIKTKKYVDRSLSNNYIDIRKFKELRMAESKVDINDMLEFISKNKSYINEFPLHDVYTQIIAKKFREEFDLYLSHDRFEIESIKFKASSTWVTYDQLVKEYNDFSSKSGISSEDQKVKQYFDYLLRYAYFDGSETISGFDKIYLSLMFQFIYYIKTGKLQHEVGGEIEKDIKENTEYDYWSNKAFRNYTNKLLPGYRMSLMKNGKFVIKGLSSADIEKIRHVFRLFGREY